MSAPRTPSQTIGPFFGFALGAVDDPAALAAAAAGAIRVAGRIVDGEGRPVPDALVETWQLGPGGARGFCRCPTDAGGRYAVLTLKPPLLSAGAAGGPQAPHLALGIFARGLLKRLVTRVYFGDEAAANARDPLLASIADPRVRATLIAAPDEQEGGGAVAAGYRFDVRLQGEGETAFFELDV